jgi:hypothetical protein
MEFHLGPDSRRALWKLAGGQNALAPATGNIHKNVRTSDCQDSAFFSFVFRAGGSTRHLFGSGSGRIQLFLRKTLHRLCQFLFDLGVETLQPAGSPEFRLVCLLGC